MYKDKKRDDARDIIRENPFITSDAALGDDFFGREEEITRIMEFLEKRKEHNLLIHGQRRIGKTSLLLKIKEIVEASQLGKAVFFDLQNKARLDISEVLFELAVQICSVTGADIDLKQSNFSGHNFSSFFKDVFLPGLFKKLPQIRQLILLFDEFDSLGELEGVKGTPKITNIAYHMFIPLLADIKKKEFPLKFIFAVGRNYKDLDENHYGQITKAGSQIELSYFNKQELNSLLKSSDNAIPFEPGSIDRLYELTSGHPFFSQCLASSAFDAASKSEQKSVTPGIIDKQLEQAIKRHGGGVLWFWRGFPPNDKIILYLMALVKKNNKTISEKTISEEASRLNFVPAIHELERVLERLINIKVLKKTQGKKPHYDFYVEFFRKWIVIENTVEKIGKLLSKINPGIENYLMNGRFYYNQEDYATAQDYFLKVVDKFPSHYEAILYLGHIAAKLIDQDKGNIDKALEWFSRAYQLNPYGTKDEYLYVLNRKLTWLEEKGEDTQTILKEIQKINPDDSR